jgi:hypothetical protein
LVSFRCEEGEGAVAAFCFWVEGIGHRQELSKLGAIYCHVVMGKLLMKFPIYFFPMLHAFLKQVAYADVWATRSGSVWYVQCCRTEMMFIFIVGTFGKAGGKFDKLWGRLKLCKLNRYGYAMSTEKGFGFGKQIGNCGWSQFYQF